MIDQSKTTDFADLDHPDKIAAFLERCAQQCHEAASDCSANWQDSGAGRPWAIAAKELERCAKRLHDKL